MLALFDHIVQLQNELASGAIARRDRPAAQRELALARAEHVAQECALDAALDEIPRGGG